MPETPHLITVRETQSHDVAADRADLRVTVEGASLFTGQEALKKAREVAQLVSDLSASGLPPDAVFLEGVSADVQSGVLSKSSHVRYRLRVHCADLSKFADLIGIVTAQKNTSLTAIEWDYPDDTDLRDAWLLDCIARVNEKSAKIAAALGVRLLGVHTFSEEITDPEGQHFTLSDAPAGIRRSRMLGEDLGMEVSHTKTLYITVGVQYLISIYEPAH
ncbi:MAG: SIMPL domain-containing protein [Janthinobacterium lividum]